MKNIAETELHGSLLNGFSHDDIYKVLVSTKLKNGHLNMSMLPVLVSEDGEVSDPDWESTSRWDGVDLDKALKDDNELMNLEKFYSLFRFILGQYLEYPLK